MGSLARDVMGGGTSAGQAKAMNGRVANSLTAAGTTLSDALQLDATVNRITTCASGAGVKLFNGEIGDEMEVYNGGANQCVVYPHSSSGTINQISAGTGMILPIFTSCKYRRISATIWNAHMSA